MTSGQDVSEYLDTLGLVKSYFFKFFEEKKLKKNRDKKMSWCSDAPEDEAISLFAGLLVNPDVPLNHILRIHWCHWFKAQVPRKQCNSNSMLVDYNCNGITVTPSWMLLVWANQTLTITKNMKLRSREIKGSIKVSGLKTLIFFFLVSCFEW